MNNAMLIECPACGAAAGSKCNSFYSEPHKARVDMSIRLIPSQPIPEQVERPALPAMPEDLALRREDITPELADKAKKAVATHIQGLGETAYVAAQVYAAYTIMRERQFFKAKAELLSALSRIGELEKENAACADKNRQLVENCRTLEGLVDRACDAGEKAEAERDQLQAARIAYAKEFSPDANGDPDVGNIHANIRATKATLAALTSDRSQSEHNGDCPSKVRADELQKGEK